MKERRKHLSAIAILLAIAIAANAENRDTRAAGSSATFAQMKSLVGDWKAVQEGVPVTEAYKLTANGTALMAETRSANEPAMITMITVDGDRLIATHYCIAGNQPHLVATSPDDLHKGVAFRLDRVTGMKTADDWHNTGITITLDDSNHMTQTWTYLYKGKAGVDDVLAAAKEGNPPPGVLRERLFYAHLYIGLYYEAAGRAKLAREHIALAAENRVDHYMGDVARVHRDLLPQRFAPLGVLYDRHTPEHHLIFVSDDMSLREPREFRLVLIPVTGIVAIFLVTAPPAALFWSLGQINLASLYLTATILYVVSYELLHLTWHRPESSRIGSLRLVRALRRHHAIHQDPRLMQRWNFNVTVPLWDLVRRTCWRPPLHSASSAREAS